MKNIILFVFCFTVVSLQLSAAGEFFSARRIPDLALALVISLTLAFGFKASMKWILFSGILIDAYSRTVFGTMILVYFLAGWTVSLLVGTADIRSRKMFFLGSLAAIVGFFGVAKDLLLLGSSGIKNSPFQELPKIQINFFSPEYVLKILYSILAAYFLYYVLRKISRSLFLKPVKFSKARS